jgi:dolichyl-phosphate beta-glucosyltransferase
MVPSPRLSLVVPAYNEARSIRRTLQTIQAYANAAGISYELIVAADGDDGTRELVSEMGLSDPRIQVVGSAQRGGKGRGVRWGVSAATGQIIGFVDADNKTPIEELEKILPWFDRGYDLVIGSRAMPESQIEAQQRFYRRIGSRLFGVGMHLAVGLWNIHDTQCGFKFFRHDVAKDLFARQRIDGYMFDVELLYLAEQRGYRIKEAGIRWQDDGDSRLQLVAGNWQNMLDLFRIRFGRRAGRMTA